MFDHVTIRVADRAAAERFYATVLGAVGIGVSSPGETFTEWDDFSIAQASAQAPPTRRLHVAFSVADRDAVDAFWAAGTAAGHCDDGAPGPRPQYAPGYYGAFVLGPDGTNVEVVHHGPRGAP